MGPTERPCAPDGVTRHPYRATPMHIIYFSDIHIEIGESQTRTGWVDIYPLDLGPDLSLHRGRVDLAILAGDIGTIRPIRSVTAQSYAQQVSEYLGCPVVFVPGNHEYYGGLFPGDRDVLRSQPLPGVSVLDRGMAYFPHPEGQLRVLGATFWTDYSVLGDQHQAMELARRFINDHWRISLADGTQFMPEGALAEHLKSREWLSNRLEEPHLGPTIIVTHHVPHPAARNCNFPPDDPLGPIFFSDCHELIAAAAPKGVAAWIFGHHHYCVDVMISGVRLLSAQRGYPRERTGWTAPGEIDV
jgi:hypothetical protein